MKSNSPRYPLAPFVKFLARGSRKYAWSCLKNCVKILIGRKTFFHDDELFFRQYLLHVFRVRRIERINSPGLDSEGPASQALFIVHAMNFAASSGLRYVHTPFALIPHADRPMNDWAASWEAHFNLGAGEIPCTSPRHKVVSYCSNFTNLQLCFGWWGRKEELDKGFRALIPEIRCKYYANKSRRFNSDLTVAVHIRRGDVSPSQNSHYFTSTESVLRTVKLVKSILDRYRMKHRIGVYSEGDSGDFESFHSECGAELFINADPIWTMQELIEADVLVMAKGCFSYYSALISDGVKIFHSSREAFLWESASVEEFIVRELDGSFDAAEFDRQLERVIAARAQVGSP